MSLQQLLASLAQSSHVQQELQELQRCLHERQQLDAFLQSAKQAITQAYMPTEQQAQILDLEAALQSRAANELALQRWAWPGTGYVVSTSHSEELTQRADRTKVLFRPLQPGHLVVDPRLDFNRFHLINAIFALDHFMPSRTGGPSALISLFSVVSQVLLPGGVFLCSLTSNTESFVSATLALVTKPEFGFELVAQTQCPEQLQGFFAPVDAQSSAKRLYLAPHVSRQLDQQDLFHASIHYFIVFVRQ